MIVFYTYSVIEIVAQYNQVNGQYTYVQRVKGNMQVSYDDLPKLAKELGTSASHLQAVLENRARQLELKDGTIIRPVIYNYQEPRQPEPLESENFIRKMELHNQGLRHAPKASTLAGWQERTGWNE